MRSINACEHTDYWLGIALRHNFKSAPVWLVLFCWYYTLAKLGLHLDNLRKQARFHIASIYGTLRVQEYPESVFNRQGSWCWVDGLYMTLPTKITQPSIGNEEPLLNTSKDKKTWLLGRCIPRCCLIALTEALVAGYCKQLKVHWPTKNVADWLHRHQIQLKL